LVDIFQAERVKPGFQVPVFTLLSPFLKLAAKVGEGSRNGKKNSIF